LIRKCVLVNSALSGDDGNRPMPTEKFTARVKGSVLVNDRAYVLGRYGPDAWAEVLAAMDPADRETLESVLAVGWYSIGVQHRLLEAIHRELGDREPDVIAAVGRHSAELHLTRIHRVFFRMASPAYVIEKATEYWSRFYDEGRWRVVRVERGVDSALVDAPATELACRVLVAYMQRLFELVGARDVVVRHTNCRMRGGTECAFTVRWR